MHRKARTEPRGNMWRLGLTSSTSAGLLIRRLVSINTQKSTLFLKYYAEVVSFESSNPCQVLHNPLTRSFRICMSFLRKLSLYRWRDSLKRMKYSASGTYNLPVEIWREIFTIAEEQVVPPATLDSEYQYIASFEAFSSCHPNLTTEFQHLQSAQLFTLRLSLILVCKSWYYIALPQLWSHLRLNYDHSGGVLDELGQILDQNPKLASYVVRLSIIGGERYMANSLTSIRLSY